MGGAQAGVEAELTPFIEDTATAFAQADLIIARAGASTVTEIAAVGAAAPLELLGVRKMRALRRQRAYLPAGCRIDLLLVLGSPGRERIR
ncbi:MAG: glycosyltransferase, partial [Alphaproteobacteria bacterium]